MKSFKYNAETSQLEVTDKPSKKLSAIKKALSLGLSADIVDGFIAAYIPTLDPAQAVAEAWYEQHLLVESNDPAEVITRTYRDENGDEQVETLDNPYTVALNARKALESANTWLKSYRGLTSAPARPDFTMTVDEFKADNAALFSAANKSKRQLVLDAATVTVDDLVFDADPTARFNIMNALIAADLSGQTETMWKLNDNTWHNVTKEQLQQVFLLATAKLQQIMEDHG